MRLNLKNVVSYGVGLLFVGILVFYAYFRGHDVLEGPQIFLSSPENGTTTTEALALVFGTTKNAKELTLDGRPIFIDLSGNFSEQLLLMEGYNIIELTAHDAQGNETRARAEVVYIPDAHKSATTTSAD